MSSQPAATWKGNGLDIVRFWELCLEFEYDKKEILSGLEEFLIRFKDKKILDCACGTGFLTLDLIQKGYPVTCSDGSESMLQQFMKNAGQMGLKTEPYCCKWSRLSERFPNTFDLVMCRGSSLIYAGAWDRRQVNHPEIIQDALKNFFGCLRPGGILYVDTTSQENLTRAEPEIIIYPEKIISGRRIRFIDKVSEDRQKKIRIWNPAIFIDNTEYRLTRYSYYLPHSELIEMLTDCCFADIQKINIRGEHYDVFIAKKP
jgi:SAM-dependent methyltransferase